jgi:ABC-type spermidine/putrescine transport system permease subunit II
MVAKCATSIPAFALVISTDEIMLQMRTEFANATGVTPMRTIFSIVLPVIAAISVSGLMLTATLA